MYDSFTGCLCFKCPFATCLQGTFTKLYQPEMKTISKVNLICNLFWQNNGYKYIFQTHIRSLIKHLQK